MPSTTRLLAALLSFTAATALAEVTVKPLEDRVRIELDGELFTEFRYQNTGHVCFYPIIGPNYAKMTRGFPLEEIAGEERDHIHHRSLWAAHGMVNGVDYWSEAASFGNRKPKHPIGQIVHDKIVKTDSGKDRGEVVAAQKWVDPDGKTVLTSEQRLVLYSTPKTERVLDFEIALKAGAEDAVFQETKEGFAAIRIAESMRTKQPKNKPGAGHILNSAGLADAAVWGKEAAWVAMTGPIGEKTYTISFFDHPSNFRHPTRWHARDYGLFAVNPFGGSAMDPALPKESGNHTIKAGDTLKLRYRLVIEEGGADAGKIGARFDQYRQAVR